MNQVAPLGPDGTPHSASTGPAERTDPQAAIAHRYQERMARYSAEVEDWAARSRLVSNLRGLAFAVFAVAGLFALFGQVPPFVSALSALALLVFVGLIVRHSRVIAAEDGVRRLLRVNELGALRVSDKWRELPDPGEEFVDLSHPNAADLDVFGPGSLFQRMNVAHTQMGRSQLAQFLSEAAPREEVLERQEAAAALAAELELRQELESLALGIERPKTFGRPTGKTQPVDLEPLLKWGNQEEPRLASGSLIAVARVMPLITVSLMVLAGISEVTHLVWVVPLLIQVWIVLKFEPLARDVFAIVMEGEGLLGRFAPLLERLERLDLPARALKRHQERLCRDGRRPSVAMARFAKLVGWFDLRQNGLIHPIVDIVFLWDLNCLIALSKWQKADGPSLRDWFEVVADIEAISSLATLADERPDFSFPEIRSEGAEVVFDAQGLAHPLLPMGQGVKNDVSLPGRGRALLVTGSNMSGKSTLLRSMGLAQVMAQAGAPVSASHFETTLVATCTSMRISDSLQQGVSHFYAELRKLKGVLEAAQRGPVLFLLDEILHGTNSEERQVGARWLLAELLELGALGAVSTHDSELCRLPDALMGRVEQVHLRETVQNEQMTFDYQLRPGPVQGGNALRLMRSLGLNVPTA